MPRLIRCLFPTPCERPCGVSTRKPPLEAFDPARSLVDRALATRLFASTTVGLFSLLASILAVIGVYSLAAQSMSRRTREVRIRCALGAPVGRARRDLVLKGMYPVFIGLGSESPVPTAMSDLYRECSSVSDQATLSSILQPVQPLSQRHC
ncbi:MAG: FtsX-like permease family protein [Acidobacteriia bacterium]|nr:FtsX-like permease family protein [Terriglobia bacterium]